MNPTRKKLLSILLCLTLIVPLCGCTIPLRLPHSSSSIAIAIDPTEPSQVAIDWDPAALSLERAEVTVAPDGAITVTLRLPQK